MKMSHTLKALLATAALVTGSAHAQVYEIEPSHTYPAFEADHMGGLSLWRGKFLKTGGTITLDRAKKTGTVDISIDANSLDFGHAKMNEHAKGPDMFNVEKYPTITYKGKSIQFKGDTPVEVDGELTLLGTTKPVKLKINSFLCKQHPFAKREVCGADAVAEFKRSDFGLNYGQDYGFKQEVKVLVSVEALIKQ